MYQQLRRLSTNILKPPFNQTSATQKVKIAEDLWNTRDASRVAKAYTPDCCWRNRSTFIQGHDNIVQFLEEKWKKELDYKLEKTLFSFTDNKIAVHFQYEWHDNNGQWFRSYGNEHWTFNASGLMEYRDASINDLPISENERKIK